MSDIDTNVYPVDSPEFTSQILDNYSKSLSASACSKSLAEAAAGNVAPSAFTSDGNWITKIPPQGEGGLRVDIAGLPTTSWSTPTRTPYPTSTTELPTDAITTPFVYASTCNKDFFWCNSPSSPTLLCAYPTGDTWSSCQPHLSPILTGSSCSNYLCASQSGHSVYTGAVCPSGYWALDLGLLETSKYRTGVARVYSTYTASTAYCCQSGDSLGVGLWLVTIGGGVYYYDNITSLPETDYQKICVARWGSGFSQSGFQYPRTRFGMGVGYEEARMTEGYGYYVGWHVVWEEEDLETLSPKWPLLTSGMLIPTWTEGMIITSSSSCYPTGTYCMSGAARDHQFRTVVLPLILTFSIAFLIGLVIWYYCRQKRKARDKDERERTGTCRTDLLKAEKRKKIEERERWRDEERTAGRTKWWWLRRDKKGPLAGEEEEGLEIPLEVRS